MDEIQKSVHFMKAVELTVTLIAEPSRNFRKLVLLYLMKVRQPAFKNPEKNRPSSGIYRWRRRCDETSGISPLFQNQFSPVLYETFYFSPQLLSYDILTFKVYVSAKLKV